MAGGAGLSLRDQHPSMKVPPKRKGNVEEIPHMPLTRQTLNESPSEKEGK